MRIPGSSRPKAPLVRLTVQDQVEHPRRYRSKIGWKGLDVDVQVAWRRGTVRVTGRRPFLAIMGCVEEAWFLDQMHAIAGDRIGQTEGS